MAQPQFLGARNPRQSCYLRFSVTFVSIQTSANASNRKLIALTVPLSEQLTVSAETDTSGTSPHYHLRRSLQSTPLAKLSQRTVPSRINTAY